VALGLHDPVVLGLPRGGVPVAAEVAAVLGGSFDVFVARKIGAPGRRELGIGAVAEGLADPVISDITWALGVTPHDLRARVEQVREEVAERVKRYRADRPLPPLAGREIVLVDDGIATGVTAEAALLALRACRPSRLVLAAPVCAPEAIAHLATVADDVVCVESPGALRAVGEAYRDFTQITDQQVVELLGLPPPADRARSR
jgi:putative phosphoribosyl transferase